LSYDCNAPKHDLAFLLAIMINIIPISYSKVYFRVTPCDIISALQGEKERRCKNNIFTYLLF
jgi:hypothetical protein